MKIRQSDIERDLWNVIERELKSVNIVSYNKQHKTKSGYGLYTSDSLDVFMDIINCRLDRGVLHEALHKILDVHFDKFHYEVSEVLITALEAHFIEKWFGTKSEKRLNAAIRKRIKFTK